jgi:hypothetical protein
MTVSKLLMGGIAKRVSVLADGRELIYYDDADTVRPPDRAPDRRLLEPRSPTPEMRLDPLTGEWIAVAAARQNRVVMPPAGLDPLAPQVPGNPSEIPSDYDVAVFENRSPAFGPRLPDPEPADPEPADGDPSCLDGPDTGGPGTDGPGIDGPGADGTGLGRVVPAYGRC